MPAGGAAEEAVDDGPGAGSEADAEGSEPDGVGAGAAADEEAEGPTTEDEGPEAESEDDGVGAGLEDEAVEDGAGVDPFPPPLPLPPPPPALKTAGPGATNSDWSPLYRSHVRKSVFVVYAAGKVVKSEAAGAAVPSDLRLIWTQYG